MKFEQKQFNTLYTTYIKENWSRCTDPWYMDILYEFLLPVAQANRDIDKINLIQKNQEKNEQRKNEIVDKYIMQQSRELDLLAEQKKAEIDIEIDLRKKELKNNFLSYKKRIG